MKSNFDNQCFNIALPFNKYIAAVGSKTGEQASWPPVPVVLNDFEIGRGGITRTFHSKTTAQ
ncbi:MAG: hypothetical protein IPM98_21420 [Lewinellaceae bacterium]|nr:hypothetical protein [Lewinellaceae bacterium]